MIATESALLVRCPAAEPVVGRWRADLDLAARDGVPAHLTVLYPLPGDVSARELDSLADACGRLEPFEMVGARVAWFGDQVAYVAPQDPAPFARLTAAAVAVFPDHPPYEGAHDDVIPHLTVAHLGSVDQRREAAADVAERLPVRQHVDHVELWSGPVVGSAPAPWPWRRVHRFALGGAVRRGSRTPSA